MEFKNTLPPIIAQNIYPFAHPASEYMLKKINSFLIDENGNLASFSRFKSKVYDVTNDFEPKDLEREYHNVIRLAQLEDRARCEKQFNNL